MVRAVVLEPTDNRVDRIRETPVVGVGLRTLPWKPKPPTILDRAGSQAGASVAGQNLDFTLLWKSPEIISGSDP